MPMNNPDWENLIRKVRNALATLQCNLPEGGDINEKKKHFIIKKRR